MSIINTKKIEEIEKIANNVLEQFNRLEVQVTNQINSLNSVYTHQLELISQQASLIDDGTQQISELLQKSNIINTGNSNKDLAINMGINLALNTISSTYKSVKSFFAKKKNEKLINELLEKAESLEKEYATAYQKSLDELKPKKQEFAKQNLSIIRDIKPFLENELQNITNTLIKSISLTLDTNNIDPYNKEIEKLKTIYSLYKNLCLKHNKINECYDILRRWEKDDRTIIQRINISEQFNNEIYQLLKKNSIPKQLASLSDFTNKYSIGMNMLLSGDLIQCESDNISNEHLMSLLYKDKEIKNMILTVQKFYNKKRILFFLKDIKDYKYIHNNYLNNSELIEEYHRK